MPERHSGVPAKQTDLGYYLIVTDTEATEKCYFEGLYESLPREIQKHLRIDVVPNIKTQKLIDKCLELLRKDPQYREGWIIFDRDQVPNFDKIIFDAKKSGLNVGWSNPCFEIWMFAYFGEMPTIIESTKCCSEFSKIFKKNTSRDYSKSDIQMYSLLYNKGDENQALRIAKQKFLCHFAENKKYSEMYSCTTVFKIVQEIRDRVRCAGVQALS